MATGGTIIAGRYELLEMLGEGGMGTVHRARHLISQRIVALKLIRQHIAGRTGGPQRFLREASAAARIEHPGIVQVLDAGTDPLTGQLYIAMELLEGESFRARLERCGADVVAHLRSMAELLDALAAAHAQGFVHRDIKPDNIFIASAQGTTPERVKLLDFGLARHVEHDATTQTGAILGTPRYIAPEQATTARTPLPASDMWSVGVMLFEIVTGQPPFVGETPAALVVALVTTDAPRVAARNPRAPSVLADAIDRCLARDPSVRPTAHELRATIGSVLSLPIALPTLPPGSGTSPPTVGAIPTTAERSRSSRPAPPQSSRPAAPQTSPPAAPQTSPPAPLPVGRGGGSILAYVAGVVLALAALSAGGLALYYVLREPQPAAPAWTFATSGRARFAYPATWSVVRSIAENNAVAVGEARGARPLPRSARLVVEPFDGSLDRYYRLGLDAALANRGQRMQSGDATAGRWAAGYVELLHASAVPAFRETTLVTVVEGMGYVLHCYCAPDDEAGIVICRYIARSLVVD